MRLSRQSGIRTRRAAAGRIAAATLCCLAGAAAAQAPSVPPPAPPAIGGFDIYGSERIDVDALRAELRPTLEAFLAAAVGGDAAALEAAAARIEAAIEPFGPFASSSFSMTRDFGANPGYYLMIDLVEPADAARRMPFREPDPATTADLADPDGLIADWYAYQDRFFELLSAGELSNTAELDCPALHCLAPFEHPDLAPYLARFDDGVAAHETALREIVERGRDAGQRAAAVFLLAHTESAAALLPLLERAMLDPDSTVRNNAMRVMIALAMRDPGLDFPIDALIRAMDFPTASDRNKSAETVAVLAADTRYRDRILAGALRTCLKLIRLEQPNNRDPAHRILMSVSGLTLPAGDIAGWEAWVGSVTPDDEP